MIIEFIFNPLFAILNVLLSPLQALNFVVDTTIFDYFFQVLSVVCFVIPLPQLMPIILFIFATMVFRIAIRIIKTIWELLPIL